VLHLWSGFPPLSPQCLGNSSGRSLPLCRAEPCVERCRPFETAAAPRLMSWDLLRVRLGMFEVSHFAVCRQACGKSRDRTPSFRVFHKSPFGASPHSWTPGRSVNRGIGESVPAEPKLRARAWQGSDDSKGVWKTRSCEKIWHRWRTGTKEGSLASAAGRAVFQQ
jgi:hypothetical protein